MKKLQPYAVNDRQNLSDASANVKIKRHNQKELQNVLPSVLAAYDDYDTHNGNPHALKPLPALTVREQYALKLLYTTEDGEYQYLKDLRTLGKTKSCPVCGSLAGATLDHYLAKKVYPEYAVYSWNLVPACFDCNTHHSVKFAGASPNERMIHPYFDTFVDQRLLSVEFSPPYRGAKLSLVPINVKGAERATCLWHIENVINKTAAPERIAAMWADMVRDQSSAEQIFGKHWFLCRLRARVKSNMLQTDVMNGGENNWQSALYHGIYSDKRVLQWLLKGRP